MKAHFSLVVTLPLLLVGCGSSSDTSFADAAPTYETLAMDLDDSESTPPTALTSADQAGDVCHPHLFVRTHDLVHRINRNLYKFLRAVEAVIVNKVSALQDGTREWEKVRDGVDTKLSVTKAGDVYSFTLALKGIGDATFVTVFTGTIDRTGVTAPHQGQGELTLDLSALKSAIPSEPVAGVITATFDVNATSRKLVVEAQNVLWDVTGETDVPDGLKVPRSGHYVYYREPGKGGSLKISDAMVFLCPANPNLAPANVDLITRWYRPADGTRHGRSDVRMLNGQLPSHSITEVVGVTCHEATAEQAASVEGQWLMKAEDSAGATIVGQVYTSGDGETPCDPTFGAVPSVDSSASDFNFDAVSFDDSEPYPFPGM